MVEIDRWIDIDGEEFKQIENAAFIYRFTLRAIELKAIAPDKNGNLYFGDIPSHVELNGKFVGLRYSKQASN